MSHRFPSADDAADPRAFGEMDPPAEPTCGKCDYVECRCCCFCDGEGDGEVGGPTDVRLRCFECDGTGVL